MNINITEMDKLQKAMQNFQGNVEETVNDVLHNYAGPILEEEVMRLMPASKRIWKGKKKAASKTKSLMIVKENLAVVVKPKKAYQYLYFPDDGSNTQRHVGNKQFFKRSGENKKKDVIDRCIGRLVDDFENR